jgi:hypothetical protein
MNMGAGISIRFCHRRPMRTGANRASIANALLFTAAVSVAPGAVIAQPADPQAQLVEQIAQLRVEAGTTAAELIGPLHVLGLLYQESGDHVLAVTALEEARHVTRVHRGLSSVDEALLLRQQIQNEKALADPERAWNHQQDMLTIARKHLDDLRVVPILRELADDRSQVLEKVRAGQYPPELYLGCYYSEARPRYDDASAQRYHADGDDSCRFGTRDNVVMRLREEVLLYYADAIEAIVKNGDYASGELRDLERRAVAIEFFAPYRVLPSAGNATVGLTRFTGVRIECPSETLDELLARDIVGDCLEPVVHSDGHVVANVGSWVSLVRLIAYEIRSGASDADRAHAFVELADWHLLSAPGDRRHFEKSTDSALEIYERAYAELRRDDEARAALFSPALPVTLPAHEPNPLAAVSAGAPSRYIDVAFDVTKYGRGERIAILDSGEGATRAEQRDLIRLIESMSFRPRFVDGVLAESARVFVRYGLER